MLLVGCFASMPSNLVGILLPLQLKDSLGETGATVYGYLNSLNGFVVISCTPILTILLKKLTEIPKVILGMLLFVAGICFFSTGAAVALLFIGMFVFTLGEVITVLGHNPYNSRRIPASHRGRVGGISTVVHSIFSSLTQYMISIILILSKSNYRLIWTVFICCGLASAVMYGFMYIPDRKTFPKLYEKK
jgi:MFS family permease